MIGLERQEIMETNKYNDIEIQTAKNMLRFGYRWIVRNNGVLFVHRSKPYKSNTDWWRSDGEIGIAVCDFVPIFENIQASDTEPTSIESIVYPQILDDAEKRYLKGVIRPFRDRVKYIAKIYVDHLIGDPDYYLFIRFTDGSGDMNFPVFHETDMYKDMEINRKYTLEELGL